MLLRCVGIQQSERARQAETNALNNAECCNDYWPAYRFLLSVEYKSELYLDPGHYDTASYQEEYNKTNLPSNRLWQEALSLKHSCLLQAGHKSCISSIQ